MERFVEKPNLPAGLVTVAAIGEIYLEMLSIPLYKLGISMFSVPKNPKIGEFVSYHADMSIFHCGMDRLIAADAVYSKLCANNCFGFKIVCAGSKQKPDFPNDINLNACMVGDKLTHDFRYTDAQILKNITEQTKRLSVKQAYSKCSVCVLDERHIITADKGIAKAADIAGIETLLIRPGYIDLKGFDTGFIGGCCGKISNDTIAFTGHLKNHPDEASILSFIASAGSRTEYLTDMPAFDVGSIIPLKERLGP